MACPYLDDLYLFNVDILVATGPMALVRLVQPWPYWFLSGERKHTTVAAEAVDLY